jgi:methyl halide transferase
MAMVSESVTPRGGATMSQAEGPTTVTPHDWDERYKTGNQPWDTQRPSAELVRVLAEGFVTPGSALELGCGTGTNAIYLAEQGFRVTAADISAVAIDRARQHAQTALLRIDFFIADVAALPAQQPFDFVFDRGCYHCVRRTNLPGYLATVDRLTRPGTRFLLLTGNANDESTSEGPPRVSEQEIRTELGTLFNIEWIRPFHFENVDGSPGPLAWSVGLVRRDA